MINIGLNPNSFPKYLLKATTLLFQPWKWQNGRATAKLESQLTQMLGGKVFLMNSGREALYLLLKSLNLPPNSEVLLQAFTCMVVTNSIAWNNLKPVYVDITEQYNMSPEDLIKKLTPNSKVLILQHTFGIPAEIEKIKKICDEKGIIIIEDCAHSLGSKHNNQHLGTFGQAAIYSFGRSKVISGVTGGAALINNPNQNQQFTETFTHHFNKLKTTPNPVNFKNLLHPLITAFARNTENFFKLGKIVMLLASKFKILTKEVAKNEKQGIQTKDFPLKMANYSAELILPGLKKLDKFTKKRQETAQTYFNQLNLGLNPSKIPGANWLRYPIQTDNSKILLSKAKKQGITLGPSWYPVPVAPSDVDATKTHYIPGSCQNAEKICSKVLNLPTMFWLKPKQIQKISKIFSNETNSKN